ncbi:MAG: DUF5673 domain-containing protein [Candidatus Komeilibacteria bacterium]|nr:DUF5673 domain-containing protein [Candidatus Komeilibacteria bacterium]
MEENRNNYIDGKYVGQTLIAWAIPEYEQYDRGRLWYIIAGIVAALLLVYSFFSANVLFGLIIVIAGVTIFLMDRQRPALIDLHLTTKGIIAGQKFHDYTEIKSFYIIYNPEEIKKLFLEFHSVLKPRLNIELDDQNPNEIRTLLKQYIEEDLEKEEEPLSESLGRMFKL